MSASHPRAVLTTVLALAGLALVGPTGALGATPGPVRPPLTEPDIVTDDPVLDPNLGQTASAYAPINVAELRRPYVFRRDLTPGELQTELFDELAPVDRAKGPQPLRSRGRRSSGP